MKNIIKSVKGTRDFYPEKMALRTWLYTNIRQVSESFGYQEYEAPLLETIDLYAAKSGDELVKEQSFVFPDRSGGLITLRPELTPSLVRMVANKQRQLTYPLRWWSFGPFWRYERPQKGRSREFFQWNIDLIGVASSEADAEMAAIMVAFFKNVGLSSDEVTVQVNNRRLIDEKLAGLDIDAEHRPSVIRLIDRRDKLSSSDWEEYALSLGLVSDQIDGLQKLLGDNDLWKESPELVQFFKAVDAFDINDYVRFNPEIIRGLDYYTGTVFEAKALTPDIRRAVLGGGRYDNLMADVGGDPLPGTGFAMGDMVISLLLEKYGHIPSGLDISPAPILVTVFDEDSILASHSFASTLRNGGLKVACYPTSAKLGKQLKYAERIGSKLAIIIGPDEIAQGQVGVKVLATREQRNIPRETAAISIQDMLAGEPSS